MNSHSLSVNFEAAVWRNLLTFNAQQLNWQWDLAESDIVAWLQKCKPYISLSIAACVGAEFDLETLAISTDCFPKPFVK